MFVNSSSRRTFLKATLAGALTWYGLAGTAQANVAPASQGTNLSLYNTHTGERLSVDLRNLDGAYDPSALEALNRLHRCHHTNEQTVMDVCTLEYLNLVDKGLGGGHEIHVISAYRSPKYNELLIRKGHRVARHSLHLSGRAIDISFPSVGLEEVRRTALALRRGGVGFYPRDGFVHLDSGGVRTW
ncbi:MAG TPA: DUF882 domain-containing protein [Desulfurivibrionaceae bacterium]|nr:DUF882 domain-containing protein [Desulfurivibrionaceae bacterium]